MHEQTYMHLYNTYISVQNGGNEDGEGSGGEPYEERLRSLGLFFLCKEITHLI